MKTLSSVEELTTAEATPERSKFNIGPDGIYDNSQTADAVRPAMHRTPLTKTCRNLLPGSAVTTLPHSVHDDSIGMLVLK